MLAYEWLNNARDVMSLIEKTQIGNIRRAAEVMADTIECGVVTPRCPSKRCIQELVALSGSTP
jgi:hypothetical protein